MGGNNNGTDNVEANLERFAAEVGVSFEVVRKCRQTAAAWGSEKRFSDVSWGVHQVLAAHQELIQPGMTVAQARASSTFIGSWTRAAAWSPPNRVGGASKLVWRTRGLPVPE